MDNENFILVKLNKLVSTLENEVESVFSDLSEEDLQDLIDNDRQEQIIYLLSRTVTGFNFKP